MERRREIALTLGEWIAQAVVGLLVAAIWKWVFDNWSIWSLVVVIPATVIGVWLWYLIYKGRYRQAAVVAAIGVLAGVGGSVAWTIFAPESTDDCGVDLADDAVDVMVVWQHEELEGFCNLVAGFSPGVNVDSVGPMIKDALDNAFEEHDAPDVAIIPQPSLVRDYATEGRLCRTPDEVASLFPSQWNDLVTAQPDEIGEAHVYGATVKGTHKSLFWYSLDVFGRDRLETWSWSDLVDWVTDSARATDGEQTGAPLALPARDRWPLTDWFENQLAGTDPDLYERLADGDDVEWDTPSIRRALTEMATLWGTQGVFADGPAGAEASSWRDLPRQLYDRRAALMFGPSFLAGPIDDLPGNYSLQPVSFPELSHGRPLVVGGDFAVVPGSSDSCARTTAARDFVEWLTDRDTMRSWSRHDDGFLTPNEDSPYLESADTPSERVRAFLTVLIRPARGARLHFDLSDDQFAMSGEGDNRDTWNIFYEFFRNVAEDRVTVSCAVDRTIADLQAEYEGEPPVDIPCN